MAIKIYDYANHVTEIAIPDDKVISSIYVNILSGDETGIIVFTDGSHIRFDASDFRFTSFYDGNYVVCGENIQKWIEFDFRDCDLKKSHYRRSVFE